MGLNLKILKMSPALSAWRYIRKALQNRLAILPMFLFAKTLHTVMTLWRRYDVRKNTADVILFREIQWKKMDNLMFKQRFRCELGWNKVKYARITITHVCFIALTLAWSLGRCLKTRPLGLVFKQLPRDPANVNARKNMCDPYNVKWEAYKRKLFNNISMVLQGDG